MTAAATCATPECHRATHAKGYCNSHYEQMRYRGLIEVRELAINIEYPVIGEWGEHAACRNDRTGMMHVIPASAHGDNRYKGDPTKIAKAKAVCRTCPVQFECAQWALTGDHDPVAFSVAGALTPWQRRQIRDNRKQKAG